MKQETTTKKKMIGTLKLTIENNKRSPKETMQWKLTKELQSFQPLVLNLNEKKLNMDAPNFLHVMEEIIKPPYFRDMTCNEHLHAWGCTIDS